MEDDISHVSRPAKNEMFVAVWRTTELLTEIGLFCQVPQVEVPSPHLSDSDSKTQ